MRIYQDNAFINWYMREIVHTNCCAVTFGHYVFAMPDYRPNLDRPERDSILWHEYIHVLQQEGGSLGYGVNYLNVARTEGTGPSNRYEALAYLWQGWEETFQRFGDKPPWCSFKPLSGNHPGC